MLPCDSKSVLPCVAQLQACSDSFLLVSVHSGSLCYDRRTFEEVLAKAVLTIIQVSMDVAASGFLPLDPVVVPLLQFGNLTYVFARMTLSRRPSRRVLRVLSIAVKDPYKGSRAAAVLHTILDEVYDSAVEFSPLTEAIVVVTHRHAITGISTERIQAVLRDAGYIQEKADQWHKRIERSRPALPSCSSSSSEEDLVAADSECSVNGKRPAPV